MRILSARDESMMDRFAQRAGNDFTLIDLAMKQASQQASLQDRRATVDDVLRCIDELNK